MNATWAGTRLSIGLTMVVGVLSLITGIANIASPAELGLLQQYIPESVRMAAGFTGALTGFVILLSGFGMRQGLRSAWYSAIVLLPITALQGIVQSSPLSIPLIVLSVVAMPTLLLNRRRFDRSLELSSTQLAAGAALGGAMAYGTAGAFALRDEFRGIDTMLDAFYYTLVTATTVGYGDAVPESQLARVFSLSVVVVGASSFAVALGALLGPAIEARFAAALGRMSDSQLELLEDHVIVLGYGELTEPLLTALSGRSEFVVVTRNQSNVPEFDERDINVLVADPSDETTLQRAGIDRARAIVVATDDDGEDALSVLTAREYNPAIRIVAAATNEENVPKLETAGANVVLSPTIIGGTLLVRSSMREPVESIRE